MSKGGLGASARAFLSARAAPHVGADGFVSKVYATPEEALHDFTDGVKVLAAIALCRPPGV